MNEPFEPSESELPEVVRGSWHRFLDTHEPLRPELYRYCRHLTRSPWDAEDLVQDALARAFVTLGQMGGPPENPRAGLFRVTSNLWIDRARRLRREQPLEDREPHPVPAVDHVGARKAAGTLLVALSPQERAAVVLKDAFDLSLDEIATALSTTVGTVKSALHRARGKLVEPAIPEDAPPPAPAVVSGFVAAFNAGDIDRLTALLLDTSAVEVVGATTQYGPEAARRTVVHGTRIEARWHRGEWLFVHFYQHADGEAVRAISRVEADGDRVALLRNYFFTPDFVADVCGELGPPWKPNGYRWWLTGRC